MTGAYAYTPAIWPPLAGVIFLAAIGLYCWRRRNVPAALPLLAVSLFGALLLLGIALEAAAVAPATKIAWFRFQGVWRAPSVTAGLCFVLEYAYPGRWLTRRNLILLSIPALLDVLPGRHQRFATHVAPAGGRTWTGRWWRTWLQPASFWRPTGWASSWSMPLFCSGCSSARRSIAGP